MPNKRGAALLTALLVVAIVAAIAVSLISHLQIDIQRSELNFNADSAYLASQDVRNWAIATYDDLYSANQPSPTEPHWPVTMHAQQLPGGNIAGALENAQGRFNINDLTNPAYQPILAHLITQLLPHISYQQSLQLAKIVNQCLTPQTNIGAMSPVYQHMQPPYRSAHRTMITATELRLVNGFNATITNKLLPYLIALPENTSIDVNAAPAIVLIAAGISITGANNVINYLKMHPSFENMTKFEKISGFQLPTSKTSTPLIGITSQYFYARANITLGKVYFVGYYLLQYRPELKSLRVIRYSQGSL